MAINTRNPIVFDTAYTLAATNLIKFFETSSGNTINAPNAAYTALESRAKDVFDTNLENGRVILQTALTFKTAFLELISGDDGSDLDTIRDHRAFLKDSVFKLSVGDTEVVTVPATFLTPMTYAEYTGIVGHANTATNMQSMAATRGIALNLGGVMIPANTKFGGEIAFRSAFTPPSAKVFTSRLILSAQ